MRELLAELLKLQQSAMNASHLARKNGDLELYEALRDMGRKSSEAIAKLARPTGAETVVS
jgi:hypothetical protein